jgi:hypothetical protein
MSKANSSNRHLRSTLSLLLVAGLATAGLTGCEGCGDKPEEKKDTQPAEPEEDVQEEKDTVDMEKAREEAEEAAIGISISMLDTAKYISGNVEAEEEPSKPAPSVRKPDNPSGTIDTAKLRAVFRDTSGQARDCYERALKQNPNLAGKVILSITIATDGSVSSAVANGQTLNNAKVNSCLEQQARRWSFPKPEGGAARVNKPYTFSPKQ